MFFSVPLLLLVPTVLAVPSGLSPWVAPLRERQLSHRSNRLQHRANGPLKGPNDQWAGAVILEANNVFQSATGTFTVPDVSGRAGDCATVMVSIDGDACVSAQFSAGVSMTVEGEPTYLAWYQWWPGPTYQFSVDTGFNISAGDTMKLTVETSSTTTGTAKIENLTTRQSSSGDVTSSAPLCQSDLSWIVQRLFEDEVQLPLANFNDVTFINAEATGSHAHYYPANATYVADIELNNKFLTSSSVDGSSVKIHHV